jgi:hypothetical protein
LALCVVRPCVDVLKWLAGAVYKPGGETRRSHTGSVPLLPRLLLLWPALND